MLCVATSVAKIEVNVETDMGDYLDRQEIEFLNFNLSEFPFFSGLLSVEFSKKIMKCLFSVFLLFVFWKYFL